MEKEDQSLWNLHLRSPMYSLGRFTYAMGGSTMIAGVFHELARSISVDYLKIMPKTPSGTVIFLVGLGMRVTGGTMINNFSKRELKSDVEIFKELI